MRPIVSLFVQSKCLIPKHKPLHCNNLLFAARACSGKNVGSFNTYTENQFMLYQTDAIYLCHPWTSCLSYARPLKGDQTK